MGSVKTFGKKHPSEVIVYGVDFASKLDTGDSISGIDSVTVSVRQGTDATPSAILSGAASFVGDIVSQTVINGVDGVRYEILVLVDTTNGETLSGCGVLHVTSDC